MNPVLVYDRQFVPALFGPWGERHAALAGIEAGHDVLDVACGTGALTIVAAQRAGPTGSAVGLDLHPEMLEVARANAPEIQWMEGNAEALPFEDARFDRVVSQFGFMFFDQPVTALREMARVCRPGGRLLVAVCDGLDHSPGYAVFTELLHRLFGAEVAQAFRAPFQRGDRRLMAGLAREAGLDATVERHAGLMRFDSVSALVSAERACAWTLGGMLDDAQFERLTEEAMESLAPFVDDTGQVAFDVPSLAIHATT